MHLEPNIILREKRKQMPMKYKPIEQNSIEKATKKKKKEIKHLWITKYNYKLSCYSCLLATSANPTNDELYFDSTTNSFNYL